MARTRISFDKLNKDTVLVLVKDPENINSQLIKLKQSGMNVKIYSDASHLYEELCSMSTPAYIMISRQAPGSMARIMPEFVLKRFSSPVILFDEIQDDLESPTTTYDNEILEVPGILGVGQFNSELVTSTLKSFEEIYSQKLNKINSIAGEDPTLSLEQKNNVAKVKAEKIIQRINQSLTESQVHFKPSDPFSLHSCKVIDEDKMGYFIFAFPLITQEKEPKDCIELIETHIREIVGPQALIQHAPMGVSGEFVHELMRRSDELKSGQFCNSPMIMLFFRGRKDPQEIHMTKAGDRIHLEIEDWWMKLPVPCHMYIWMNASQKRVLYVRPGDKLREESYERFRKKDFNDMVIDEIDLPAYQATYEIATITKKSA